MKSAWSPRINNESFESIKNVGFNFFEENYVCLHQYPCWQNIYWNGMLEKHKVRLFKLWSTILIWGKFLEIVVEYICSDKKIKKNSNIKKTKKKFSNILENEFSENIFPVTHYLKFSVRGIWAYFLKSLLSVCCRCMTCFISSTFLTRRTDGWYMSNWKVLMQR